MLRAGAHLEGQDLSDLDWSDVDLTDATLVGCTLAEVQTTGLVAQGARFRHCHFVRTGFAHADLREAVFEACQFIDDTGHEGVRFAFGRLEMARFETCDLAFARFERIDLYGLEMKACNLRGAVFNRVDFSRSFGRKVVRASATFHQCRMDLCDLAEARLPSCDLKGSTFREADLRDLDLTGADLRECDLFQALLDGADLTGADLRGAEISGLDIRRLKAFRDLKIEADQQAALMRAMDIDVF